MIHGFLIRGIFRALVILPPTPCSNRQPRFRIKKTNGVPNHVQKTNCDCRSFVPSVHAWSADMANGQQIKQELRTVSRRLRSGAWANSATHRRTSARILVKAMKDYNVPHPRPPDGADLADRQIPLSAISNDARGLPRWTSSHQKKTIKKKTSPTAKTVLGRSAGRMIPSLYLPIRRARWTIRQRSEHAPDDVGISVLAADVPAEFRASSHDLSDSIQITDITQTVVRHGALTRASPGKRPRAMLAKAEEIDGLKKVGQQKVSFLSNRTSRCRTFDLPVLQSTDARMMVIADPVFSSYMPCRISMVEDANGKLWLMMLNLDMLINSKLLPASVVETAVKVNQQMLDVMTAGASGKP